MKKVGIITYAETSGLYYLADRLSKGFLVGNEVVFFPKIRLKKVNGLYKKDVSIKVNDSRFVEVSKDNYSEDIINFCKKENIELIYSLESLISKELISIAHCIDIIDIPMLEWVSKKSLEKNEYKIFKDIYCVSDICYDVFSKYHFCKRMPIKLASGVFNSTGRDKNLFYHQCSTNKDFSHKNTTEVLKAFKKFSLEFPSSKFVLTGYMTKKELELAKDIKNIKYFNEILDISQISEYFNEAGCFVAPSTKEGLGLGYVEAKEAGAKVISTNYSPMNEFSDYNCDARVVLDSTLQPKAYVSYLEIFNKMIDYYMEDVCQK
jgi:glycosyltransferase involved in cell wall biosynthesis